jgi:phosphatidylglycerol:prolipoprotein diacylglycerol transferase
VLFYKRALLLEFSRDFPWWGVLKIHQGGMASHGGMIGVMIAAWMVSRGFRNEEGIRVGRCPVLHVYDACAIMSTPGLFFGRLANFVNGELLGHIVAAPGAAAPWWSVKYPQELVSGHAPVLTDAQTVELVRLVQPFLPASGNFAQGVERMIVRLHAGDAELATKLGALLAARHPSQLYQAGAEGIVLAGVLWFVWMKPRKPGVVAGWFLVAYAVLRIIIEQFFRLPDADIPGAVVLGFSRGQWLSAGILMVGAALWLVAARSAGARLGGWGAKA